jgi:hypothetical protein
MPGIVGRVLALGLAFLAGVGGVASLVVHLAALGGTSLLGDGSAGLFTLHVGVFVVFVPMVLASFVQGLATQRGFDLGGRLAKTVALVLILYAVANLLWCMNLMSERKASSTTQVAAVDPLTARAFSGHWMLFYFVPFAYFARRALGVAR